MFISIIFTIRVLCYYFHNFIDISGGNLILRDGNFYMPFNGNIYSSNNRIEFNDISNNIYFHTPIKMYYNYCITCYYYIIL